MINLSCRNYNLIIDGLDCTTALTEINGNYDHYQSGTGYVKISANLTLKRPAYDWSESLDHRTNARWMRGKEVTFQIANENGVLSPCPVLGKLYILTASFDGNITLNLTAGCILNLLDFRSPSGDGVCFQPGDSQSLNYVAEILLSKSGVSNFEIDLSGSLSDPLSKLSNESYIQLLGKICYANNYLMFQDNLGVVKFKKLDIDQAFENNIINLVVGQHDVSYKPLTGNETPSEIYKVSGIKKTTITIKETESVTEREGYYANPESETTYHGLIERITQKVDQISGRNVVSETVLERLAGLLSSYFAGDLGLIKAEKTTSTRYFASESYATKCSDTDNGELLKSVEVVLSPRGMFDQFYQKLEELTEAAGDKIILSGLRSLVTAKKTTISYSYELDDREYELLEENSGRYQLGKVTKTTLIEQPKGIMGIWEAMTEVDEVEMWQFFNESQLTIGELIEEKWLELSPNQWKYSINHQQAAYLADPTEVVDHMNVLRSKDVEILNYDFFWNLQTIENTKSRSFTANQPPFIERFPTPEQTIETQIIAIEEFPSFTYDYQAKIKEISIDSGLLTSLDQARDIAKLEGSITWGKYRGSSCTTALFDEFLSVNPLDNCCWLEVTDHKHSFLIDGFSVAFESNQIAVSFDGIWTGEAKRIIANGSVSYLVTGDEVIEIVGNDAIITIEGQDPIIIPDGVEDEILLPVLQVLGLPKRYSVKGMSKNKGYFNYYWYDINAINQYSLLGDQTALGYFDYVLGLTYCDLDLSALRIVNINFCDLSFDSVRNTQISFCDLDFSKIQLYPVDFCDLDYSTVRQFLAFDFCDLDFAATRTDPTTKNIDFCDLDYTGIRIYQPVANADFCDINLTTLRSDPTTKNINFCDLDFATARNDPTTKNIDFCDLDYTLFRSLTNSLNFCDLDYNVYRNLTNALDFCDLDLTLLR